MAESVLKKVEGEMTLQDVVALSIAEKRLQESSEFAVGDTEWIILKVPKEKIVEK